MELLLKVGSGIIVIVATIIFFKTQHVNKRPKWSGLSLKILLAGISSGTAFAGVLVIGGLKDIVQIFVFGVLASIVGGLSVLLSWGSHEIYTWLIRNRLDRKK